MPFELAAARDQRLAVLDRLEEPLTARDDLHRALALLEELDCVRDRLGLADQIAGCLELSDDRASRLIDAASAQLRIAGAGALGVDALPARFAPGHVDEASIITEDCAHGQPQLTPPGDIGEIAERADHHQAGALFRLDERVCEHRDAHAEQRCQQLAAGEVAPASVVGVREHGHARRDQLRAGGFDLAALTCGERAVGGRARERDTVHGARALAVLELGLGDGGAKVDVPQRRRLQLVGLTSREQAQEGALRDPLRELPDRRVGERPVDRQAEPAP